MENNFWDGKCVLITGGSGFKGSWLSIWLIEMGAKVINYSIGPPYANGLFDLARLKNKIHEDITGDIRDLNKLDSVFCKYNPDIVIHLAAQAIVRTSYDIPRETFEINIMGTINVMECARKYKTKSVVLITSDKCYKNIEQEKGYIETDVFSDQDPYSCSKGCAEMVINSYRKSFGLKVASARAGNVIGGGDFAKDRLIPDIIKAITAGDDIIIRSPNAVRPWQFVLEPLRGYMLLAQLQYTGMDLSEGWNFGPKKKSMIPVKDIVELMIKEYHRGNLVIQEDKTKHEAGLLFLDCNKAKEKISWEPKLTIQESIKYISEWYQNYESENVYQLCVSQIKRYENEK